MSYPEGRIMCGANIDTVNTLDGNLLLDIWYGYLQYKAGDERPGIRRAAMQILSAGDTGYEYHVDYQDIK
eukprot:777671-Pleurochrysis_carterae.AAC.5